MKKYLSEWERAKNLHKIAAEHGFDWPNIPPVIEKLKEEVLEFEAAFHSNNAAHIAEELGDVLFVCSYILRKLETDAETLMQAANEKFQRRFDGIKQMVEKSGKPWDAFTLAELEVFWQQVKQEEKANYFNTLAMTNTINT